MSATSKAEALRKEGLFVPKEKKAPRAQISPKTGDKDSGEKQAPQTVLRDQKDSTMTQPAAQNTVAPVAPAVLGTTLAEAAPAAAPAQGIALVVNPNPIFSARRAGGLVVDTVVVVATTAALVGAGYGVYHLATKK